MNNIFLSSFTWNRWRPRNNFCNFCIFWCSD